MRHIIAAVAVTLLLLTLPFAIASSTDDETAEDRQAAREARAAERAAHAEARSAALAGLRENWTKLHESWEAESVSIKAACRAAEKDENATHDEKVDAAHCIRDGYRAWRELHREDFRALKQSFRAFMSLGRGHAA